ncbi:MAG TPA: TRAP transporter large permease subunit, partial [Gammaproteobacteria bacterium]|nr:TRAP transporter large permease subunit [Gammaproteobacteria bacterium]
VLGRTWPAMILLVVVIGGIYMGIFTPTEAAAVSLFLAVLIGFARGRLNPGVVWTALVETTRQTTSIFLIALAAKLFVSFSSLTRIAPQLLDWVQGTGASMVLVMAMIVVFYLLLGMFLDSIGILVLTLPFVVPLVESYGLDLIWFGVVVIKLLEIGLITPPVGLNVFVIKLASPPSVTVEIIFAGVAWFLILDVLVLALVLLVPAVSLTIPGAAW